MYARAGLFFFFLIAAQPNQISYFQNAVPVPSNLTPLRRSIAAEHFFPPGFMVFIIVF